MTAPAATQEAVPTWSPKDYAEAFVIAKRALAYVAEFQTPPTPEVYEIWYHFAQGDIVELSEQLSFAVKELQSVGRDRIEQLHREFFARAESNDRNASLSNNLATELGGLNSMIKTQISISDDFDAAVTSAGDNLRGNSDPDEVRSCVEVVLATSEQMQGQLRELKTQLEESHANVQKLRDEFAASQKDLHTDPLTGVGNRRFFDSVMQQAVDASAAAESSSILMLIDLDRFKQINDTFGHAAGDEVLRYVSSKMQQVASDAQIARYGGDEFAVFLDCDHPSLGLKLANGLCEYFANNRLKLRKTGETLGNVGLSIGLALLRADDSAESWFDRADKLLYSAKQSGRGRVMAERKLNLESDANA